MRAPAWPRSVRASWSERTEALPGDELIREAIGSTTYAVTLRCGRRAIWPWLVQMGAGRAGWYSYDFVDNGRRRSAERIRPELQAIAVGALFPGLPGATEGYRVAAYEPESFLVLGWPAPDGSPLTTWAFVLEEARPDRTRLIVRSRVGPAYDFAGVLRAVVRVRAPAWLSRPLVLSGHFLMQRRQLQGIARRAERAEPAGPAAEA